METLFARGDEVAIVFVCLLFGGGAVVWIISVIAENWRKVKQSEHLAILKQQMLDRGMTAADIEKVLNAGQGKPPHMMS